MNVVISDGKTYESIALYFYPEENMLYDEDGRPIFDIFTYITPLIWHVFKFNKSYMCVKNKNNVYVELFYPIPDEDDYLE